jgi:hypothetical protein
MAPKVFYVRLFKDNGLKGRLLGPLKSDKLKAVLENIK